MVFNSYTFILFLAVVLAVHHLPIPWRTQKANLLVASYLFYAAWNPPFVLLLMISTVADWFIARRLFRAESPAGRRWLLGLSLGVNLGMLGFFKYSNFLMDNFADLLGGLGVAYRPPELDIILPVGISFYTFQTLSYTIDIYRRQAEPWHSFLDYALYVSFFPQLVAGPIVRATTFLPQCEERRRADGPMLGWGLSLLTLGLFQKIVLADGVFAPLAEELYGNPAPPGTLTAWAGTLAFAGQIFCDFAGYSTCAIGVALCLGFALPDNFRFPYAAVGFSDFWRRWHISLSTWLRDYLYIPLGGNRRGPTRTQLNLMVTMLLGGLWHGAAWTFVIWGGLHGLLLIIERRLAQRWGAAAVWQRPLGQLVLGILTFGLVCFTWVFFRAGSLDHALQTCGAMLGFAAGEGLHHLPTKQLLAGLGLGAGLFAWHWIMRSTTVEAAAARTPWPIRALLLAGMLIAIVLFPGEDRAFIYFQF
jgi:D-alanyl-lipoteichoic acid acyltransferase DltB (MBOAT superfamily)